MRQFIKISILFSLLLLGFTSKAQNWSLIMEMVVTEDGKKRAGAEINVYRDGKFVEKVLTDGKGMADIPMKPGGVYTVEIGGNDGLIKKKLEINTNGVPPEDIQGETYFPAEVDVFKKIDGLDYNILNKPIGKIQYDPSIAGFDADRGYTKEMKSKLEQLEEDYLEKKEQEAQNEAQKQKQYDEAIKVADKAFKEEKWEEAETYYKKAAELMPIETYPSFQLAELETKLIKIRETNKKYDDAIGKADAALASKDYETAIAEFKRASGYKPDEEYPQTKIKEVQTLLAKQAKVEQDYLTAIERGDNALKASDLNTAKTSFEEAAALKPEESYPKNKLAEINAELEKRNAKEQEYQDAIKAADEALAAKDYELAKSSYQKALGIKPAEKYPADQMAKVDELLAAEAKKQQDYLAAIQKGDDALTANDFATAKAAFEEAIKIKSDEEYPKNKIKEIDELLAKQEAKEQEYQNKIKEADQALASQSYENAKTLYQEASSLKPAETYPQEKIKEINTLLAEQAKQDENYNAAIQKGDQALAAEDFEAAKVAYNEALSIKADEQYPKDKLSEIEGIVVKMQESEAAYQKAIQNGDDALTNEDFENAKKFYQEALSLKAEEQYPKDKLQEIDDKEKALAEADAKYTAAIEAADAAFSSKDYETAKKEYETALSIKAEEKYPQEKLSEISKLMAEAAEQNAAYDAAIQKGDELLANTDLEGAKSAYEEALKIKEEQYPKDKIAEIDKQIAEQAEKEANYTAAIEKADALFDKESWAEAQTAYEEALSIKEDDYPKGKIAELKTKLEQLAAEEEAAAKLEADYQAAIAEGDQFTNDKKYPEAIVAFQKASELKSDEAYPKDKIKELEALQKQLAEEAEAKAKQERLQAQYDSLINVADGQMAANELENARKNYQEALSLKSEESYPKEKIDEINTTLADAEEQEKAYVEAIKEADKLFEKEELEASKAKYIEASSIKSEEQYPKDKIVEIDAKLEALAAEQEEIRLKEAAEAEKDAKYQALIAEADQLLGENKLDEAQAKYEEALTVKEEQYPKDQLAAIETRRGELAAAEQEAAAAEEQAKLDAQYQALIAEADQLLGESKLDEAQAKYEEALTVKEEQYPKDQLAAIESRRKELATAEQEAAAAEEQAKLEAQYQALIAEADQLLGENKLDEAQAKYEEALTVKEEQYPKDQLTAIETRRQELAAAKQEEAAAEEQAKIEAQYQALIAEADQLLGDNKLDEAQAKYEEALTIKEEQYPKDQLAAIETRRKELAAAKQEQAAAEEQAKLEAQYQALIAEADQLLGESKLDEAQAKYEEALTVKEEQYPKDQLAAIEEQRAAIALKTAEKEKAQKEAQYQALIAEGDALLADNNLEGAKGKYEEALGVLENPYPAQQIAEIEKRLQELAEKQALEAKAAQKEANYQMAIAEGDQALANKNYDVALAAYQKALGIKAEETYPATKIQEIEQLKLAQAEQNELLQRKYEAAMTEGQTLFTEGDFKGAIRAYERAQTLKPNETLPQDKIREAELAIANAKAKEEEIRLQQQREAENEMAYQTAIANADKLYQEKNYNDAENEYRLALSLKPSKTYPQEQMDKIAAYFKAKADAQSKAKQDAIQYEQFINEGDDAFKKEIYLKAKSKYQAALGIKKESYPKEQLVIIEQKLEEQRISKAEALKKMDEPIQIQTGPKATIDGDAEARIDALYKEMWSKKNSNKNETLTEKQKVLEELKNKEREAEEKRRLEAQSKIEDISVSLKKQTEEVDELNLKNYETIKVKEKAISEEVVENRNEAKRDREDVMAEKEGFLANQEKNNQERNLQLVEGKKEFVENENEEIKISREYRYSKQDERIGEEQNKVVEIDEDIRTFNQEKAKNRGEEHTKMLNEKSEKYTEVHKEYVEGGNERTEKENENIEEFREDLIEEQQQKQANSFKYGQEVVDEQKQAVPEYEKELVNDADRRIGEQQENINDQAQLDQQMKNERKDNYSENQEKIEKIQVDLKEETESLNAESEKRRQENSEKEYYSGEDKPRQDPESAEYPQGVTEKIIENSNGSTTIRRIVVEGTQTDIYEKTLYSWGGIFYTKNGANITKEIWDEESR